jgi:hypothetical protein
MLWVFLCLNIRMGSPNLYDSKTAITRPCIVCGVDVPSEMNIGQTAAGQRIVWYTPASRYWTDAGVFCCAQHSFDWTQKDKVGKS